MNLIVLLITGMILKSKIRIKYYMAASTVGALWALLPFITKLPDWVFSLPMGLGTAAVMTRIAWKAAGLKEILKRTAVLYGVTWFLGGMMNALYYWTGIGVYVRSLIYGKENSATVLWLIAAGIIAAGCLLAYYYYYCHYNKLYCKAELLMGENKVEINALCDTGNSLYTISGKPVSIVELSILEKLSKEKAEMVKKILEGETPETTDQLTFVTFQSIGKEHGIMPVIWIDTMIIKKGAAEKAVSKAAIGISNTCFSEGRKYQLILHKKLSVF